MASQTVPIPVNLIAEKKKINEKVKIVKAKEQNTKLDDKKQKNSKKTIEKKTNKDDTPIVKAEPKSEDKAV